MSATERPRDRTPGREAAASPRAAVSVDGPPADRAQLLAEFDRLIRERRLFGAEVDPEVLKKSGKGVKFLVRKPPSLRRMAALWTGLFGARVLPSRLLELLAPPIHGFVHIDATLLFSGDRVIYDTRIAHGGEPVGEMTLFFQKETERGRGLLGLFRGRAYRIVYIENISLREQSSGYASALFRHYEGLFSCLGFNRFRLKASLSVGKYYWAKEGFDCLEESGVASMRRELLRLVREKGLPVRESEIERLNHAYDVALFRRDIKIPVYRNAEGYYALSPGAGHTQEFIFPLGKAFLLTSGPWDGYKVIYTDTPRRTGFVYSDEYLEHRTRPGHVETPKRLARLLSAIDRDSLRDSLIMLRPYRPDAGTLARVHDPAYLDAFRASAAAGAAQFATRDCSICERSYEVALLAAGGVMAGIDAVMNGRVDNVFCAVRPPGHHAGRAAAMGFCFVNNVAVGAAHARAEYGVERIFILDWDVHHGNGTQELFEEDPSVYFCSIHEHPTFCYPGTGRRMDRGKGKGFGATLNIPLRPHTGDDELIALFDREVIPAIERFRPELILLSAGFDAHRDDPIADIDITERSYVHMTRAVCEAASRLCSGRVVSVLEGGYFGPSFASSVVAHIKALQGRSE